MKKLTLSVAAVMAMSTFAVAGGDIAPVEPVIVEEAPVVDSGFYMGLGYTYLNLNIETDDDGGHEMDVDTSATTFLAGYKFNPYIAVEGRYIPQFAGVEFDDGDSIEGSIYNLALYAKGMYPVTSSFDIYALVGYGITSVTIEEGDSETFSDNGFQFGIGASYDLSEHTSLFIDYSVLYNDSEFDDLLSSDDNIDLYLDAITFGMTYKF